MSILLNKIKQLIIFFALCSFVVGCEEKYAHQKVIVFSRIYCKGCVQNAFKYISEKQLDKRFTIILDSNSYYDILPAYTFRYKQMRNEKIKAVFGDFGNFILIDSTGRKIEFLTDMTLQDYIQ